MDDAFPIIGGFVMRWRRAAAGLIIAAVWCGSSQAAGDHIPQRYLGAWALEVSGSCDPDSGQFGGFRILPTEIIMKQPPIHVKNQSMPALDLVQHVVAVSTLPEGIEVVFTFPDKPGQHRIRFLPGSDANSMGFQFVHGADQKVYMEPIPLRRCR